MSASGTTPVPGSIPAPPSAEMNTDDIAGAVTAAAAVAVTAPEPANKGGRTPPPVQADYGPSAEANDLCPSPDTDPLHRFFYFGFGSNMLPAQLLLKKVHVHSARRGILRDVQLLFDLATKSLVEPSYANLKRHPAGSGYATHGILYELEARDQATMDRVEGGGRSYVREAFVCELYADDAAGAESKLPEGSVTRSDTGAAFVTTFAYICHADNLSKLQLREVPPSRRYLDVLITGAKHHRLQPDYVKWLEAQPCTPLPVLSFTEQQRRDIEAKEFTSEQLAEGGWKDYMDTMPAAQWKDPLLMTIKGIVFDVRLSPYGDSWKKHNGGKCLTMFTAGRVATGTGVSLPQSLEELTREHHDYINATLVDWANQYIIVGHMTDREKYDF